MVMGVVVEFVMVSHHLHPLSHPHQIHRHKSLNQETRCVILDRGFAVVLKIVEMAKILISVAVTESVLAQVV